MMMASSASANLQCKDPSTRAYVQLEQLFIHRALSRDLRGEAFVAVFESAPQLEANMCCHALTTTCIVFHRYLGCIDRLKWIH